MTTVQTNKVPDDLLATMNGTKSKSTAVEETQDRFMKLLVTQMKNQDPLNPLDNAQVTSQMAQLSTVTGIDKLNTTLQALQGSYQTSQTLQATDMIGHGVLVPGSDIALVEGASVFGVDIPESIDSMQVTIRAPGGQVVRTMNMGAQEAGTLPLTWDGKTDKGEDAPDGVYKFQISAVREDKAIATKTLSFGEVSSVTSGAAGIKLTIPGLGTVGFADVRQIY
ncbi:flagellar hook assembly protein FlgD [Noviherbaspirillum sp. CPCC 100848]|uniref:Basal-body rod modification protein FlgD n=1 Tax=Noviherbaspirillum album TaxID=3080276 RepID=A0ABU6JCJ6_9BURK|nr:flagellar hook assembly protein FlgD [Noviherbaspirillum sp. CPCC 100848]MEC4721373.1 flagellar hook assembly protein FlgD [Noviherbaspirillum sp. CPCC 100848]